MTDQDVAINRLVFALTDDGGLGLNLHDFAVDEGYDTAISRVEGWRDAIEDMIDSTADPEHAMTAMLLTLRGRLNLYLTNLMLQRPK